MNEEKLIIQESFDVLSTLIQSSLSKRREIERNGLMQLRKKFHELHVRFPMTLKYSVINELYMLSNLRLNQNFNKMKEMLGLPVVYSQYDIDLYASYRGFKKDQDRAGLFKTKDGILKGFIICDGTSQEGYNARGEIAAEFFVNEFKKLFENTEYEEIKSQGIEKFLNINLLELEEKFQDYLDQLGIEIATTTMIMVMSDGRYVYLYYIGDGYIYLVDMDSMQFSDVMLKKATTRGQLIGYLGSFRKKRSAFLPNFAQFSIDANLLIVLAGSDGSLLEPYEEVGLGLLWDYLMEIKRAEKAGYSVSLKKIVDIYLNKLLPSSEMFRNNKDDASLGIMVLRYRG